MDYAVIGAGAIGGYYGGRLAEHGNNVHFLFHSEYQTVIEKGYHISSVKGNVTFYPPSLAERENLCIKAYNAPSQMPKCDVIIVAMKTTSNNQLPRILKQVCKTNAVVILFQNGLGMERDVFNMIHAEMPEVSVAGAMAFICSSRTTPGCISHFDYGDVTLSPLDANDAHVAEVLQQVSKDFNNSKVKASYDPNLLARRWQKLLWNVPYNGLTVALNTSTDVLMNTPSSRQIVKDIMQEVVNAANTCGVKFADNAIEKMLTFTDNMRPYAPSMKLDFDNHRQLETEYIYTRPIQSAKEHGYMMQKTEMLLHELQFIQGQYLK